MRTTADAPRDDRDAGCAIFTWLVDDGPHGCHVVVTWGWSRRVEWPVLDSLPLVSNPPTASPSTHARTVVATDGSGRAPWRDPRRTFALHREAPMILRPARGPQGGAGVAGGAPHRELR